MKEIVSTAIHHHKSLSLDTFYDTIIIGSGLAGLSAAYELRDQNLMILEKNDYPGGRVLTGNYNGIIYELGSLFAYRKDILPFEFEGSDLIHEEDPIGLYCDGTLYYGRTGLECLLKSGIPIEQVNQCFEAGDWDAISKEIYDKFNAFFRVIHPGNITDAVPQRRLDALIKFKTHHFEQGNQELITALLKRSNSTIAFNTEVVSVEEQKDCVKTVFQQEEHFKEVFSKTVMVSTPAPVAKKIITHLCPQSLNFLESLQYGEGTVVVVGFQNLDFHNFAYIVTSQLPVNTIFRCRTRHDHINVLVAYYVAEHSSQLQDVADQEITSQTLDILRQIHPYNDNLTEKMILFTRVHRWTDVGPIISPESYHNWMPECSRPSDRVFLCGDYQFVDFENLMPYGMTAAILSGRQTAQNVKDFLHV